MVGAFKYRVTGIACLIGCFLYPWRARAQEQGERAAAEVLFEQGRDAMSEGDYDEACAKFEASMDLDPAPGTLMNLGNCEEQRGNIASAWERYVAAQRELPSTDRRREFAAQKAEQLEEKVPRLTITLADGAPKNTHVRRDDIDLTGSLGISLPLDPGAYQFTAGAGSPLSSASRMPLDPSRRLGEPAVRKDAFAHSERARTLQTRIPTARRRR